MRRARVFRLTRTAVGALLLTSGGAAAWNATHSQSALPSLPPAVAPAPATPPAPPMPQVVAARPTTTARTEPSPPTTAAPSVPARPAATAPVAGCHRPADGARQAIVCMAGTPDGGGYWLAGADGGVLTFGDASFFGSLSGRALAGPVVAMAATPDGRGYWLAGYDGGVFAFGDAGYLGGMGGRRLAAPIVGMAATRTGRGYWLVSSDGGVFGFGDAAFLGGMGGQRLSSPVVGLTPTPDDHGYWLVSADGGVFTYGTARYLGGMGGDGLAAPILGLAPTPDGHGYWLASSDGGVFTYGDAPYLGGMGGNGIRAPVVALSATPDGRGYFLAAADGGVFTYGTARFRGSAWSAHVGPTILASLERPGPRVAIFYYPWYSSPPRSAAWRHWNEGGRNPPGDIGSDFYPRRGAYDSGDPTVVDAQMQEIAAAGVGEVIVSWWGRGSFEDSQLGALRQAITDHGMTMAIHLEPYGGRSAGQVASDLNFLHATYGVSQVFAYQAADMGAGDWAAAIAAAPGVQVWATGDPGSMKDGGFEAWARSAGFSGVYSYDGYNFSGSDFPGLCAQAAAHQLACSPSVAPGFQSVRATGRPQVRSRDGGATYDSMWQGALASGAGLVTITSYNEWHEGTQIEPAQDRCGPGWCYASYDGAWGLNGAAAQGAYLARTRYWVDLSRSQ